MLDAATILRGVIPLYLILLLGFAARRGKVLGSEVEHALASLTIRVLIPCLILDKILGSEALRQTGTVIWAVTLGALGIVAGILISLAWGKLTRMQKGSGLRTFALATGVQNYGFTAIPVVAAIAPGSAVMGVLFVHNLGVEITMWSFGLLILSGSATGIGKALVNGPVIAVLSGMLLVKSGFDTHIPAAMRSAFHLLGETAVPLSMFMVGMTMADLIFSQRPGLKVVASAVILRLGVLAMILLAAAKFLPIAPELKTVLVVQAAMPSAVFPIVLARHYGGSPAVAVQITVFTGLAALFTMPFVVAWGLQWVFPA